MVQPRQPTSRALRIRAGHSPGGLSRSGASRPSRNVRAGCVALKPRGKRNEGGSGRFASLARVFSPRRICRARAPSELRRPTSRRYRQAQQSRTWTSCHTSKTRASSTGSRTSTFCEANSGVAALLHRRRHRRADPIEESLLDLVREVRTLGADSEAYPWAIAQGDSYARVHHVEAYTLGDMNLIGIEAVYLYSGLLEGVSNFGQCGCSRSRGWGG